MNVNYLKIYENELEKIKNMKAKPSLLLHTCCAPCLSGVIEELYEYFDITLYFYNPNISPESEFELRLKELYKLTEDMGYSDIKIAAPPYNPLEFEKMARGLEDIPEGGKRCFLCYDLRLENTFSYAKKNKFDYVTTTLSVSPYKNAAKLNEKGEELSLKYGVKYLISDFKKKNGYKRSCENSAKYGLYRQNYCGCVYSKALTDVKEIKYFNSGTPSEARQIREEVFIKEQGFKEEYDEIDNFATHLVLYLNGEAVGTLRLFTLDNPETYILGRLAVKKDSRGKGLGSYLVRGALKYVKNQGGDELILHSQLHAEEFYKKLGFTEYGEIEYEEDCPHIWMRKKCK